MILDAWAGYARHLNHWVCYGSKDNFYTRRLVDMRDRASAYEQIVPSPMRAQKGLTIDGRPSQHTLDNTGPRLCLVAEFDFAPVNKRRKLDHLGGSDHQMPRRGTGRSRYERGPLRAFAKPRPSLANCLFRWQISPGLVPLPRCRRNRAAPLVSQRSAHDRRLSVDLDPIPVCQDARRRARRRPPAID